MGSFTSLGSDGILVFLVDMCAFGASFVCFFGISLSFFWCFFWLFFYVSLALVNGFEFSLHFFGLPTWV